MRYFIVTLSLIFLTAYDTSSEFCEDDFKSLCGSSEETKSNCLQDNFDKIKDKKCKEDLEKSRSLWLKKSESFEKIKKICEKDVDKNCPEDKDTRKNYLVCLMMNGDKISEECKKTMNLHIENYMPGINKIK